MRGAAFRTARNADEADGTVSRIDPETDLVTATIKVGERVSGIAVDAGQVWVGVP